MHILLSKMIKTINNYPVITLYTVTTPDSINIDAKA